MYYSNEYKQQVYKKWIDNGRPWFNVDRSKEPTADERQIILEMKKQEERPKSKHDLAIEKRAKEISERYGKYGKISNKVFDSLRDY
jgi:hypothetical protein